MQFIPITFILVWFGIGYLRLIFIILLPSWNTICLTHCVAAMVSLIKERLQIINTLIQGIIDQNLHVVSLIDNKKQEKNLKILCHVCSWHHNIAKLMGLTTNTFGLQMVAFFGYAFMVIVMQVYLICQLLKTEIVWHSLIQHVLATASFSYTVYKICNMCEYTVREVSAYVQIKIGYKFIKL